MTAARRRAAGAFAFAFAFLAGVNAVAVVWLWRASIPGDLHLPRLDVREHFGAAHLEEAHA